MATSLTYADFATHLPGLATPDSAANQVLILQFINHAELVVPRSIFGEDIISTSNVSRADLAVLYRAGHEWEMHLRLIAADGLSSPGQVTSHADNRGSIGYGTIGGTGIDAILSTTISGARYLILRASRPMVAFPMVVCG